MDSVLKLSSVKIVINHIVLKVWYNLHSYFLLYLNPKYLDVDPKGLYRTGYISYKPS